MQRNTIDNTTLDTVLRRQGLGSANSSLILFNTDFQDSLWQSWAVEDTWFTNDVTGNTTNSGTDSTHPITWDELRRRMIAAGGHVTDGTVIIVQEDMDYLLFDWPIIGNISVYLRGATSVVRSGSCTTTNAARNPATNTPNTLTDSVVSDWTSDIGFTSGRLLNPTSGAAVGYPAWVIKNLGSHTARVSTFFDINNFVETQMSNGDTYNILSMPFVQNYYFAQTEGFLYVEYLDIGDANSTIFRIFPSPGGMEFNFCSIYWISLTNSTIFLSNCCLKSNPNIYTSTVQMIAGAGGDITGFVQGGEIEKGGELIMDYGAIFQGVRQNVINGGFLRIGDGMFFDSPDYAFVAGVDGRVRMDIISGSGQAAKGILVSNTGVVWGQLSQCYITGTNGDVEFANVAYTWAQIQASNGIQAINGFGGISQNGASQGRLQAVKGANVVAANNLTLGIDGNLFTITGNTQINAITTVGWRAGSQITLLFTGTPTIKNNTAGGAGTAVLLLAGSADLTAANNTVLGFLFDGTQWQETFRKVA